MQSHSFNILCVVKFERLVRVDFAAAFFCKCRFVLVLFLILFLNIYHLCSCSVVLLRILVFYVASVVSFLSYFLVHFLPHIRLWMF